MVIIDKGACLEGLCARESVEKIPKGRSGPFPGHRDSMDGPLANRAVVLDRIL